MDAEELGHENSKATMGYIQNVHCVAAADFGRRTRTGCAALSNLPQIILTH